MNIIGLDAAVQDKDIGCVFGEYRRGRLLLMQKWERKEPLEDFIFACIRDSPSAILAIDAPLGWPVSFRKVLNNHCAGRPLDVDPQSFFKRKTDLDVRQRFRKTPLEISADRIARTAFFTLQRLGKVEKQIDKKLELLWDVKSRNDHGLLEVYPAATLLANGLSIKGYKKENITARKKLYEELGALYNFSNPLNLDLTEVEHDFDALVCCLACADFIEGKSRAPDVLDREIKEEGWIWIKEQKLI